MTSTTLARSLARCSRVMLRPAVVRTFSATAWAHHEPDEPRSGTKKSFRPAHVDAKVPDSDYYEGHLVADHLEYLDDVMEKSIQLESELGDLQKIYDKKQELYNNVGFTTSDEIDQLFLDAKVKKARMRAQLAEMKAIIESAKRTIAVDAPDGTPDDIVAHEMEEIGHIIDDAAIFEDKDAVLKQQAEAEAAKRTIAVDAPDGTPDDIVAHEMEEIAHIIDDAAILEDKEAILKQRADAEASRKVFGVDAPDGIPDAVKVEDLHAVEEIIERAAHENKKAGDSRS